MNSTPSTSTSDRSAGPSAGTATDPASDTGVRRDATGGSEMAGLADETTALVRRWLQASADIPADVSAERLAGVLKDPKGLDFTVGFVDGVIRPEDPRVAAHNFRAIARDVPRFLPLHLRAAVRLGAVVGLLLPWLVIPVVRRVLRGMVGHLIIDARDRQLGRGIKALKDTGRDGSREGVRLNLNLLGEAVLGEREAGRRLEGTTRLLKRDDVDYVSIKVSSVVSPHNPWAFDEAVAHMVERLTPLYRLAARSKQRKFINLDMEEYRDLELTMAVFTTVLDRPEFLDLEAGIVLQAYLPDSLAAMQRLQGWAADRVARGGAPIKVRVVKGANLPMERVEADVHDWPLATWHSKQASDTHYKRVLDYALRPERVRNVRVGLAGHNLFDIALAWILAGRRGVRDGLELEMLLGMAQGQAEVVRRDIGGLLLYTPVVKPGEFDVAIAYLIRRLEEGASHENFMSAVFDLHEDEALFERERRRFLASLADVDDTVPSPNRVQDRSTEEPQALVSGFHNVPDTDPALRANLTWGREILSRVPTSRVAVDLVQATTVESADELEGVLARATGEGQAWGRLSGAERATYLREAAAELERRRGQLLEVAAAECGKTLDQSDPEVSEAIDFANFYAQLAEQLDDVDGAVFSPVGLTVVTPPWNFPLAIPCGSMLAALAAGSAVVAKPAPQAQRCGSAIVEALWAAGIPRDALQLVHVEEGDLGRQLVSDERVDRLILTGGFETAALFRSFRRDLPLLAETSGKNSIIVTASADLDLAVKDVVYSAFGHAGQKCSAASTVILVGSAARSKRFRNQLVDAVASLPVGLPEAATPRMGPVIEPVQGKLKKVLTTLDKGESWVVEPKQLDHDGKLWTPGVKEGVRRGSEYHLTEYFGPVLGIMTADTLEEAIEIQNEVDYGLTAGLHSLDSDELATWIDRVAAGNLYVNRGITGAIVQRQPFGGWKKSAIGAGTKAGGPNYLVGLGSWTSRPAIATTEPGGASPALLAALDGLVDAAERDTVARSLRSDAAWWADEFGATKDVTGLEAERNLFRYAPVPVTVRHVDGSVAPLVRVVAAGLLAGAPVAVSMGEDGHGALSRRLRKELASRGVAVTVEDESAWLRRAADLGHGPEGARIRLVGDPAGLPAAASAVTEATDGRPEIAVYAQPVTESGRVELLPFLHEQAVSITAHRFGTPNDLSAGVI